MGMFTQFLNPRKPRQFNYTPMYYDPEKEEREERIKALKEKYNYKDSGKEKEYMPNIKGQFRAGNQKNKNIVHKINFRHIVILAVLFIIALLLMDKLPSYYQLF